MSYHGETIDIKAILERVKKAGEAHGWTREVYYNNEFDFVGMTRKTNTTSHPKNIYISAGIHGDEPAGPLALLQLLEEDSLPRDANFFVCPCLNPRGFVENTRENEKKIDLNRDYKDPKTPEVQAHVSWLEKQPEFDLSLCFHEDWESKGFYLFCAKKTAPAALEITAEVAKVFPIDLSSTIDGFPAEKGLVIPDMDIHKIPQWPEALYLREKKKAMNFTFEAASVFPLEERVKVLVTAAQKAITQTSQS